MDRKKAVGDILTVKNPDTHFEFKNKGPDIIETNYFESRQAKEGVLFFSPNARAIRILVPGISEKSIIPEMQTAKIVVFTKGIIPEYNQTGMDIMFEDYSETPFGILTGTNQWMLLPDDSWGEKQFICTAWTKEGKILERPGFYRKAKTIPYRYPLEGWSLN